MEFFFGRSGARRAARGTAIKICQGLYAAGEPQPDELARTICERWPDAALDGYSAASQHLDRPLRFPLAFARTGGLPKSAYFTCRRARPRNPFLVGGIPTCNPLQALEIMSPEHGVAFLEALFAGADGGRRLELHLQDFTRLPAATRRALDQAIVGADSVPERRLTTALRQHFTVDNNAKIGPYRWDLLIRDHRIAVEVDGYAYHSGENRQRFELDRQKLNDAVQRGWRPLHFTAATIEHHLDVAVAQVRAVAAGKGAFVSPPWDWHHYWRFERAADPRQGRFQGAGCNN